MSLNIPTKNQDGMTPAEAGAAIATICLGVILWDETRRGWSLNSGRSAADEAAAQAFDNVWTPNVRYESSYSAVETVLASMS